MRTKAVAFMLLILSLCFSLFSCAPREHVYCEIGITLPASYRKIDASDDFDLAFKSGSKVIGIRRFSFEAVLEDGILTTHTPMKFAEIYRDRLEGISASPMRESGDIPYFTYTITTAGGAYVYMPTFYRTPYAYIMVMLVSENRLNEGGCVEFLEICGTLRILPEYV